MGYPQDPLEKDRVQIDEDLPMKCAKIGWGPFDQTIVSLHDEGTVFIWDARTGQELHVLKAHNGPLTGLQWSEDRTMMITCAKDQTMKMWQTHTKKPWVEMKLMKADRPLNDAALSPTYSHKDPA